MITKSRKTVVRSLATIISLLVLMLYLFGCDANEPEPPLLDFTNVEKSERVDETGQRVLRVAVAAITAPRDTHRFFVAT